MAQATLMHLAGAYAPRDRMYSITVRTRWIAAAFWNGSSPPYSSSSISPISETSSSSAPSSAISSASGHTNAGNTWAAKGDTCKIIRPYRNFLVALDWYDGSSRYPHTVYWSNQADPLTVPSDWDYADPATDAGINELASTSRWLVDGLQLSDSFVIYKEDAVHLMTEVGGTFVHNFRDVSMTTGILAQGCAGEFYGRHFVFGNDDIYVHDGQSIESVASKRIRRDIFSVIDPTYYNRSFVVRNLANNEMWCCFAETGSTVINRAAVWNWKDGTWGHRQLPSPSFINSGVLFSSSDAAAWNDDSGAWNADICGSEGKGHNLLVAKVHARRS